MAKDYNIRKTSGQCSECETQLDPGTEFTATVSEGPEELIRNDYCDQCCESLTEETNAAVLCKWRTVVPHPEEKKKLLVSDDLLVNLFERLAESTEESKINFRYVLALVLMRKKLLIYDRMGANDEGQEVWSMHFKGTDASQEQLVIDPKLTEDQIAEVSNSLGEIMEGDFE
ncbi:MAG: hypothetical protein QGH94_05760 [Phycisphaerae bacterium]|jgi:hypothetical protein|nr:hypothetical protein [Phycisphaerae bacterium]MDP7287479.1 hypothetical protein [Phycisphaerae bacterium]